MTKPRTVKASTLTPDPANANRGTERGLRMLDDSLREDGAGRSILLDKNGLVIAGNKTLERAVDIGLEDVIVVPSDGTKLIAVQRMDLDLTEPGAARRMAYRDNRVAEVDLDWDLERLTADLAAGVDLSSHRPETELDALLGSLTPPEFQEYDAGSFDGVEEEWTEIKFRVPLGIVPLIEQQTDRICEACGYNQKTKGLALQRMAVLASAASEDELRAE